MKAATRAQRTAKKRHVPEGLRLLFQSLQTPAFYNAHGPTDPDAFLEVYKSLSVAAQGTNRHAFVKALAKAAQREYSVGRRGDGTLDGFGPNGDQRADQSPEIMSFVGFWAGVACAWQAMTAMSGGAR